MTTEQKFESIEAIQSKMSEIACDMENAYAIRASLPADFKKLLFAGLKQRVSEYEQRVIDSSWDDVKDDFSEDVSKFIQDVIDDRTTYENDVKIELTSMETAMKGCEKDLIGTITQLVRTTEILHTRTDGNELTIVFKKE